MTQKIINNTLVNDRAKENYIFISDIHGNHETLDLIEQAKRDFPMAQLVTGGDYIDGRGSVKEVLDYLIEQKSEGAIILRGNHEQMMLNYANECEHQDGIWFYNGGRNTLMQLFGKVASPEEVRMSKYYRFLMSCPIMYETPNIVFVHGGVRPDERYNDPSSYNSVDHGFRIDYDFYRIWARESYWYSDTLSKTIAHNKTVKTIITGHTPTCGLEGVYDDGRIMNRLAPDNCIIRKMQYPGEPARIFTDGGSHSDPMIYPHNDGNVVVVTSAGKIVKIYNYSNEEK